MILDDFWRKNFSNLINSLAASDAETLTVLVHGRAIGVWGELGLDVNSGQCIYYGVM